MFFVLFADAVTVRGLIVPFSQSLTGEAANALRGTKMLAGDAVFTACGAAVVACAITGHRQWKRLKCKKTDSCGDLPPQSPIP